MKNIVTAALLFLSVLLNPVQAQGDPGFGEEGDGDAALAPTNAPINENLTLGLLTGVLIAGYYFVYKRKENV
jgi:hypothetical protein